MEKRKLTKEDIDKVRNIEGFPIGSDEDIIALSDAPYYTACPNPFLGDFIAEHGHPYEENTDSYQRKPFASDISEGKNDCVYNAHSYHTKVPYKAIQRYILHYTEPGDIVLDGFSGTGMTGVAAQMCGHPEQDFKLAVERDQKVAWGTRKAILSDLSPSAAFITHNYNQAYSSKKFLEDAERVLTACTKECGWMYETLHVTGNQPTQMSFDDVSSIPKGQINYTVWSDVIICPNCGKEMVFWDVAVDESKGKVADEFSCPHCNAKSTKKECSRAFETYYDEKLGTTVSVGKQSPVYINYTYSGRRYEKRLDDFDYVRIQKINEWKFPYEYPTDRMCEGTESRRNDRYGITHVHQFFTRANLYTLATIAHYAQTNEMRCLIGDIIPRGSKMHKIAVSRLNTNLSKTAGILSGTLYIPSNSIEYSVVSMLESRIADVSRFLDMLHDETNTIITTQSSTDLRLVPNNSIDYIFTDPPFGDNLNYSELSFLNEAWLKVFTNNGNEAIVNKSQNKGILEYQELMNRCFAEYCRVLKPNRWMTVEFHNSKNAVWNAIQESLQRAGFVIADVRTLDKKQTSFKQVTTSSAVKQDLVISAYKPKDSFRREFSLGMGSSETAWAFVRQHLENLPVVVANNGSIEVLSERQAFLLFDRMVAYHIMCGIAVPMDATDFYRGLDERYLKRDNMYFLPDQVNEYDMARATCDVEIIQFSLFVSDEKSAIGWLYQQLDANGGVGPQTYQDLMPKFMQELKAVDKREKMPELMEILEENFLKDEDGKWYIPDLTKSGDIAKLREKNLLKEFQEYLNSKGKLKVFRSEAIRAGFAKLWKDKDYAAIVAMANRLPEETIQEDQNLLMYYDISLSRV